MEKRLNTMELKGPSTKSSQPTLQANKGHISGKKGIHKLTKMRQIYQKRQTKKSMKSPKEERDVSEENYEGGRLTAPSKQKKVKLSADRINNENDSISSNTPDFWTKEEELKAKSILSMKTPEKEPVLCGICKIEVKESEKCDLCPEKHTEWIHKECSTKISEELKIKQMQLTDLTDNMKKISEFFPQKTIGDIANKQLVFWRCPFCRRRVFLKANSDSGPHQNSDSDFDHLDDLADGSTSHLVFIFLP